ncbi:MAG TPA: mechanosensitive ion channel family protein [Clostridia bacterium]|mgnify:CR=1 FL=1|nr:mechanosensitive ion channel family protein [Clostridia bacterium]HPQ47227.1 mechanosensitive ion channel family protein [Clostridia bacterium]HRX42814.1 mechanosensitive ion channel family protein [Clostridia bacterium]
MFFTIGAVGGPWSIPWPDVIDYGIRIAGVILGFFVFRIILKLMMKVLVRRLEKKNIKNTFHSFIISLTKAALWIIVGLIFLQILKVPMTPLITALGALGIGIGLALKDHMSNIAGGVMIAINKQFDVGDYIKCTDIEGFIEDVELFFTRLKTFDNKIIYAPNSIFAANNVTNYTRENLRRVDVSIGVSYDSGIDNVRKTINDILESNELIKKEPASFIGITSYGDSSVNFIIRAWAETSHYWEVYFFINERLKKEFDKNGIVIPFPQLDVHKI